MKSVTVCTCLDPKEVVLLEGVARLEGSDRSALIKKVLREGPRELLLERAIDAFRKEEVTLSRAAERLLRRIAKEEGLRVVGSGSVCEAGSHECGGRQAVGRDRNLGSPSSDLHRALQEDRW